MKNNSLLLVAGGILAIIGIIILHPTLSFLVGWLSGFLVELFLGDIPANWLNHVFDTDRFAKGDLAKITALLAVVSSFLRTKVTTGDKDK